MEQINQAHEENVVVQVFTRTTGTRIIAGGHVVEYAACNMSGC